MTGLRQLLCVAALGLAAGTAGAQLSYDMSSPSAREAFRTGVLAYNAGRYAESLLFFEQALATQARDATPGANGRNPLAAYWLGKSYYRLGSSSSAFSLWREAANARGPNPFLESKLELFSMMEDPEARLPTERYIRAGEISGKSGRDTLFSRPSWVEPMPDGSLFLVSHGSNALIRISTNGTISQRITGGATGFDRPFAVLPLPDGGLVLSEFQSDRLAVLDANGNVRAYLGDPDGPGRLAGPQYLCTDGAGFVYVSDVGFSRVAKFDLNGRFILSFGTRTGEFAGLKVPTGVAYLDGHIYVADAASKGIYRFDTYGNYAGALAEGLLVRPEGLRSTGRSLLLADTLRIVEIDIEYGTAKELFRAERPSSRILSAAYDANGDLVFADFDSSELSYLSDPSMRYAGLSVEILGINQAAYPKVFVDVQVRDKAGKPIVGLAGSNFYLAQTVRQSSQAVMQERPVTVTTDTIRPALNMAFEGARDSSPRMDITFLVEGSPALASQSAQARNALAEIASSLGQGNISLVHAGSIAQPPVRGDLATLGQSIATMKASDSWRFDFALRLAAGNLATADAKRTVIYLTTGSVNDRFLDGISVAELGSLLANNGIAFVAVLLGTGSPSDTVRYLCERTGGTLVRADRPEGLGKLLDTVRTIPSGMYRLSFEATGDDEFGRAYMPLSAEVYLRGRSGKDESGFFAPSR